MSEKFDNNQIFDNIVGEGGGIVVATKH